LNETVKTRNKIYHPLGYTKREASLVEVLEPLLSQQLDIGKSFLPFLVQVI